MQDTGHILFNNFGCGNERREILDEQIKTGERSFRDVSEEMWGSLDVSVCGSAYTDSSDIVCRSRSRMASKQ
jgi:2-hydroxy-3-keto-5-methylthiopentenyl-1-phosphate phosphatase